MNDTDNNNTNALFSEASNDSLIDGECRIRTDGGNDWAFVPFLVYGICLNIVGLIGLIGNTISISILSRPNMRSSINCCLVALASFDAILIVSSLLMFGISAIPEYTGRMMWYQKDVFPWVTLASYPLGIISQTGSVYLTVTVTMERYVAVCHPLKARSICTYGRAKLYVIGAALFSLLYNIPRFWEVTYKMCKIGEEEFTTVVMSDMRQNPTYIQVYITWMYLVVMYLVPFLSLLIFNVFIYKQIRKVRNFVITSGRGQNEDGQVRLANHERQRLSRREKKELGLAVMLLFVVVVFFLCNILAFIVNVLEMFGLKIPLMTMFSNLLVTINSSVNFIIYCIFGQKFRKLFLQLFCFGIFKSYSGPDAAPHDSIMGGNSVYGDRHKTDSGGGRFAFTRSVRLSSWSDAQSNRVLQSQNNGTWNNARGGISVTSSHRNQYSNIPLLEAGGKNGNARSKRDSPSECAEDCTTVRSPLTEQDLYVKETKFDGV